MSLAPHEATSAQRTIPADVIAAMSVELAAFRRIVGSAHVAARFAPTDHPLESYWLAMEFAVASCRGEALELKQLLPLGPPVFTPANLTQAMKDLQKAGVIVTTSQASENTPPTLALHRGAVNYLGNRAVATVELLLAMTAPVLPPE